MAAVDRDVYATTDGARYATAIYGVLDAPRRRLTLVNAGHPAVLIVPSSRQRASALAATGPALGLDRGRHIRLALGHAGARHAARGVHRWRQRSAQRRRRGIRRRSAGAIDRRHAAIAAPRESAPPCSTRSASFAASRQDQDDVTVMVVKAGIRDQGSGIWNDSHTGHRRRAAGARAAEAAAERACRVEVVGEADDGVQAAETDRRAVARPGAARHPDARRQRARCRRVARQAAAGGDLLHRVRSVRGRCVRAVGARLPVEAGQPRPAGRRARSRARRRRQRDRRDAIARSSS